MFQNFVVGKNQKFRQNRMFSNDFNTAEKLPKSFRKISLENVVKNNTKLTNYSEGMLRKLLIIFVSI